MKKSILFLSFLCMIIFSISSYANTNSNNETTGQYIKGSSITADVKARLLADSSISSTNISVKTEKSVVILTGCTDTQEQISKAAKIAKEVKGVTSVTNHLKVCHK